MSTNTPAWMNVVVKQIIVRKTTINRLILFFELFLLFGWMFVFYQVISGGQVDMYQVRENGNRLGVISTVLFCITLIPGIITRHRWQTAYTMPIVAALTPIRRHIGILMFLTAFVHMSFVLTLPLVYSTIALSDLTQGSSLAEKIAVGFSAFPPELILLEQAAIVGWLLLLPVWLTSNDFSMRKLGKKWKVLQRLTYLALWFIFAHIALQGELLAIVLGMVGLLEIISWVVIRRRKSAAVASNS